MTTRHDRGGSWMLPEVTAEDLLYVSSPDDKNDDINVFSYPQGKLVGGLSITGYGVFGLCSDDKGNVFVTTAGNVNSGTSSQVYEYAHGGTQPIATLSDPAFGNDCAVDPTTGNLAVANDFGTGNGYDHGNVAVYQGGQGSATIYYDPDIYWYDWCVYDSNGNLYVDGSSEGGPYPLAELPKNGSAFEAVTLNETPLAESLQWDAGDLVISGWQWQKRQATETIYRVKLSGSRGTVVGTTTISTETKPRKRLPNLAQYTLYRKTLVGAGFNDRQVHFWRYPAGGLPTKSLLASEKYPAYGVAISVAPTHSLRK
ncbi:MAG: hypothetical protein JOZ77_12660 [Candidatus Eremiobacteraeota bacterium]|nr:hypothetical protein [Candidatus Eremiobacteraeota bacterium]